MSTQQPANKPNLFQIVRYLLGRPLPESMRDWVIGDVTGPGSTRRFIIRGVLPFLPILLAFAIFVPGPFVYRIGMIALLLIPLVYFEIALMSIYRRHLLTTNGLDGDLVDVKRRARREITKNEYEANYPRKPT